MGATNGDNRHPIILDTDALIATANTSLWETIGETLTLTTTNVCLQELKRHRREKSEYASEGSREKWIHEGSTTAIEPFEDASGFDPIGFQPRRWTVWTRFVN